MSKSVKPKPRSWRVNYSVTYIDKPTQHLYRERVLSILKNVAWLRRIDCAIAFEYPFFDDEFRCQNTERAKIQSDLVYFRSTHQTEISAKDFRKLIDGIFDEETILGFSPVEVGSLLQKSLHLYPFPKE